ncbi:MAG: TerC family protein [Deltaproteobacteria bacterium]
MFGIIDWIVFGIVVFVMLFIDLFVGHRKKHEISLQESLLWTAFWVVCAMLFCAGIYYFHSAEKAIEFLTGYLLEKTLSMDNVFVFLLVFKYFHIPKQYEYNVLSWGILGALLLRAVFIFAGVAIVTQFYWVIYIFGGFLIYTAIKMALEKDKEIHPESNPVIRMVRKAIPVTHEFHGTRFFIIKNGQRHATPIFIVVSMLMIMDVMFAVDSIPAIIAITKDPFIIYTSNVFAVMGLRSLFFALSGMMRTFHYLHYGLSAVLFFVGVKMLISSFYHITIVASLSFIVVTLFVSIIASLFAPIASAQKQKSDCEEE